MKPVTTPAYESDTKILTIRAPHFDAGVAIRKDKVIASAPILKYMRGWSKTRVLEYAAFKNWSVIESQ